jgi:hypothetical protein
MTELTRRQFAAGALAAVPAVGLLGGCGDDEAADPRARLQALVDAHVATENAHDLPGVLDTFAAQPEMVMNGVAFHEVAAIAAGHVAFGMAMEPGGLADTRVVQERSYVLDGEDALLVEGTVFAIHVGTVVGFPATQREVALPYIARYRFDGDDKLVSERIVMDWEALART